MHQKLLRKGGAALLAGTLGALGASGCGASADGAFSIECKEAGRECPSGGSGGAGHDSGTNVPTNDASSSDSGVSRSPLCGIAGCYPGNPSACGATPTVDAANYVRSTQQDGGDEAARSDGARADVDPDDAWAADAGPDADLKDTSDEPIDPGADGSADVSLDGSEDISLDGSADVSLDGSGSSDVAGDLGATDEPKVPLSCYVKPSTSGVITECAPFGPGTAGSACEDSSDCGAGLACVEVNGKPVCRPFSCALPAQCMTGNFYQQAPLRVAGVTLLDVKVPVCLPNDHCELLSTEAVCPAGQVCAVVGSEGETTCVVPGNAKLGDTCDDTTNRCAEGLICAKSKPNNQCLKICHVGSGMTECPGGACQGGNRSLPDGFGICVGGSADGGK